MDGQHIYVLISGAVVALSWVAGLFFKRFWQKTQDRLFLVFAIAFWILGLERLLPVVMNMSDERRTMLYLVRFLAFCCILYAIIDKNRRPSSNAG